MTAPRLVHRGNGDRIVILPGHSVPESAFHPEKWLVEEARLITRGVARVKAGKHRIMVKPVYNEKEGNTAFTEARLLLEMRKRGIPAEKPLAVYFRKGFKPFLLTKFVQPDAGKADLRGVLRAYRENARECFEKRVGGLDDESLGNTVTRKGKTVHIDVESAHLLDAGGQRDAQADGRLRRRYTLKDGYLAAPRRSVREFVEEVRRSFSVKR